MSLKDRPQDRPTFHVYVPFGNIYSINCYDLGFAIENRNDVCDAQGVQLRAVL